MHGWDPEVIGAVGTPQTSPEEYLDVFFARSDSSRQAGQAALKRMTSSGYPPVPPAGILAMQWEQWVLECQVSVPGRQVSSGS